MTDLSPDLALLNYLARQAQGRLRAADLHGWPEDRKAPLRAALAARRAHLGLATALPEGVTLSADDAATLCALIQGRVA